MSQCTQFTFSTASNPVSGNATEEILIPTGVTTARLTTLGLDASNTIKTQKRTSPSAAWADQTTYNSDQTNVAVTVAAGEQWRAIGVTQQALKDLRYKFSCES